MRTCAEDSSDASLLEAFADGEGQALTELVRRHYPAARRLAAAVLGDNAAAEDAIQKAFTALAESSRRFESRSFAAWWQGILNNKIKAARRKRRPPPETELEAALTALPTSLALALALRYDEGCSQAEIAARLACSRAAAGRRVRRALARLGEQLGLETGSALAELASLLAERSPLRQSPPKRLLEALASAKPRTSAGEVLWLVSAIAAIAVTVVLALAQIQKDKIAEASSKLGVGVVSPVEPAAKPWDR